MMNRSWYGRKWALKILCNDGTLFETGQDGISETQALKVTFDINYPGYEGWYFSEFNIWNLNNSTEKKLIQEGAEVYFYAGYQEDQGGSYGQIFGGKVFQSLYSRESVTDFRLTLVCVDGARLFRDNVVSFTMNKDYTDMTLMNQIAARSSSKINIKVTDKVDQTPKPRGVSVFGAPLCRLRETVRYSSSQLFVSNDEVNVVHQTDDMEVEAIIVNTDTGLVGSPMQIDHGVRFKTLLNPEIIMTNPCRWVKLDMSSINALQQKGQPGNQNLVPLLPRDGAFKIGGVRHFGDTRGDDWYTEVVGYSLASKAGAQNTVPEMMMLPKTNVN